MHYNPDYRSRFRILKGGKISLVVSAMLAGTTMSFASPSGGVVNAGNATISQNGSTTNINQSTQRASINWQSFSIAPTETVNFVQPNSSAVTLNRVVGNETSLINGALNANGQVWILNSNGILFGKNASVNTAGLVASTMNITDKNFMNGHYTFESTGSNASVINMGTIHVTDGAYVALLGKEVANQGLIQATKGTVALTAGDKVSLNFNGDSLVGIAIDQGTLNALIENKGAIIADGGTILLTTQAANDLINGVVNNSGLLQAKTLDDITGHIELYAHGGTTNVSGTVDASGGFIETSGKELSVASGTTIKAANWLIDPTNITIESAGGSDLAGSSISGGTLTSTLNGGTAVTLTATNDININQAFTWSQSLLTLTSGHDINVNAAISASGTAGLALNYTNALTMKRDDANNAFVGQVNLTSTNSLKINNNLYTIITTNTALQNINSGLGSNYVLGTNLNLNAVSFTQLGAFYGQLEGLGHTISNLTINTPATDYVGFFGSASDAHIGNIGIVRGNITGQDYVGGLVGYALSSSITNSYVSGIIKGRNYVGGLVGLLNFSPINNSYSTASINGNFSIGGLVGFCSDSSSSIVNSYATGNVSGDSLIGGLIGSVFAGDIRNSYATGTVSGNYSIGGLLGYTNVTKVNDSYATGIIKVVGSGSQYVGGLVGYLNDYSGVSSITNSYATGKITIAKDSKFFGGLVGDSGTSSTVTSSYWDTQTTGQATSAGGIGKTTAQMHSLSTFSGWNISSVGGDGTVWRIYEGNTAPLLRSFLTQITGTVSMNVGATQVYDGTTNVSNTAGKVVWSTTSGAITPNSSKLYGTALVTTTKNVGTQNVKMVNPYSNQSGYDIKTAGSGSVKITPKALTVTGTNTKDKVYDGGVTSNTTVGTLGGFVGTEKLTASVVGTFSDKNVGTAKTVTDVYTLVNGLNGGLASNYTLATTTSTASIFSK
ncbi:MAG: filamentous hemagglutinin N-terminal domain-containing protein [Sulfuricurvum sp.]